MARTFAIHKPALKNQYTIIGPSRDTSTAEECIFVKLRPALNKRPFLVIHDGPDASCPVAAVSHLPAFARHYAIGLGDPKLTEDMIWEELRIAHSSGKKHTWAMDVDNDEHRGQQRRLHLVWTRTRSVTVDGMARPPLSTRNWKLTEELPAEGRPGRQDGKAATAESILAVFTSTTQLGKCGSMQVNVDYGREFDMMLFTTCLSIYSSG
ncbi:hypothetical protein ISF_01097 [Cordyceps fumosorosea ARSEF 2679]|uniref:Uncharacterized protein n=1 Tax=Cordyceps fumosorosea (strain ARSEF 2679) TaxID=1081104 RepID=A0A168ETD4_CORFA|nr:hypothetical protein ISF_01097 [Cordyceps fumosorosea ARSEF 2679]OAA74196.1 hypothetical protein ISF_01097 [Cordyceps fumosorosea ARSEF 2679]